MKYCLNYGILKIENIVKKGEDAGDQHFLLFQCFQKPSLSGLLKVVGCVVKRWGSFHHVQVTSLKQLTYFWASLISAVSENTGNTTQNLQITNLLHYLHAFLVAHALL